MPPFPAAADRRHLWLLNGGGPASEPTPDDAAATACSKARRGPVDPELRT